MARCSRGGMGGAHSKCAAGRATRYESDDFLKSRLLLPSVNKKEGQPFFLKGSVTRPLAKKRR